MDEMMLAAVFEGEGKLEVKEMPVPRLTKPDAVLLEVEIAGVCGTDLHICEVPPGHPATPGTILGHEYVGKVLEVGEEVTHFEPGDRVVIAPNLYCGMCPYCQQGRPNQCQDFTTLGIYLHGGFAKYNVAPEAALFHISPGLPGEEAVLVELLSCIVGGTQKAKLQPGESVAILGAGPVGLMFALVFQAAGAGKIIMTDVAPYRLGFAGKIGADVVVNPQERDPVPVIVEETNGGADVVVDAVGSLLAQAVAVCGKGGRIICFGMNQQARPVVPQYDITRNELTVYGTYIGINTFPPALKMLESGVVKPSVLITHRLPLADIHKGFDAARAGQAIKVVVTP
jgi:(R,R)-butanediol dehydrogenase/meso-butanediol dehydrogenase/diacetyl reductase